MFTNKYSNNFDEDGWMLTEGIGSILFYLIMIGVVSGILYFLFASSKLSQMQQALTTIPMQIQGLYSGSSSYSGLDNALAVKAGVVPKKLMKGNNIQTPWGGAVTISVGADTGTFTIELDDIGAEDCTKLATYQMDMWESIEVNGNSFDSLASVSDAANACGDNNTLTYQGR